MVETFLCAGLFFWLGYIAGNVRGHHEGFMRACDAFEQESDNEQTA